MARKKDLSAEDVMKRMFPDLPTSEDVPVTKTADPADQTQATIKALQDQIAQMQGQLTNTSRANQALSSQAQTEMPPQYPQIDYGQAPDPVADPKGFAMFHQKATAALVAYERDNVLYLQRQQGKQATKTAQLWSDFEGSYGDYAKHTEQVEIAASRVIAKAAAKGVDTDKYMYANSAAFMQDVTKEMDRLFPGLTATGAADNDDDDDDDERTNVFGGGVQSGNGKADAQHVAPERYGNLSKDIMEWQEKTGFHR